MLLLYFLQQLTAPWISDEVKCTSSLFWCQEVLVLPSIVNQIKEIFMKWKVHQQKCWAIVSDNGTNTAKATSDLRITSTPRCSHSSVACWKSYYGTELLPVVSRDRPPSLFFFIQRYTTWYRRDFGTALSHKFIKRSNKLEQQLLCVQKLLVPKNLEIVSCSMPVQHGY